MAFFEHVQYGTEIFTYEKIYSSDCARLDGVNTSISVAEAQQTFVPMWSMELFQYLTKMHIEFLNEKCSANRYADTSFQDWFGMDRMALETEMAYELRTLNVREQYQHLGSIKAIINTHLSYTSDVLQLELRTPLLMAIGWKLINYSTF